MESRSQAGLDADGCLEGTSKRLEVGRRQRVTRLDEAMEPVLGRRRSQWFEHRACCDARAELAERDERDTPREAASLHLLPEWRVIAAGETSEHTHGRDAAAAGDVEEE